MAENSTPRSADTPGICLSADLGTAYSKCASRRGPGLEFPVEFEPNRWVLNSELAILNKEVGLAARMSDEAVVIADIKTQFRSYSRSTCVSSSGTVQPLSTFEALVYIYRVLFRRALDELQANLASELIVTLPSLAFTSCPSLKHLYEEAALSGYYLAVNTPGNWDAALPVLELRSPRITEPRPHVKLVSEPTAALSDQIHQRPGEFFALVDIGAGTTDIAIMTRFDGSDRILAEDSVPKGGRLLKGVADRLGAEISGVREISEQDFQDLFQIGRLSLGRGSLSLESVFSDGETEKWLRSINDYLESVKRRAQASRVELPNTFVESLRDNVYVAGGIGRSELARSKILRNRHDAPQRLPRPASCDRWAAIAGAEAESIFLQLAPSFGGLTLDAETSGSRPPPINQAIGNSKSLDHGDDAPG